MEYQDGDMFISEEEQANGGLFVTVQRIGEDWEFYSRSRHLPTLVRQLQNLGYTNIDPDKENSLAGHYRRVPRKGLIVNIYRTQKHPDCSRGGPSATYNEALLVGEGVDEVFEESDRRPTFILVRRQLFGREYRHVEPLEGFGKRHRMFGGNFVHTSDSRFPNDYPLPIHDRVES